MPFFSIIIPVYNVEKFLQECVNSVIEQLFKNYEIILIDDGSTDESGIMCDRFAENNKNIFVIHKKNGGPSEARNVGIEKASGDYLLFLDSDDYWDDKYALQKIYKLLNSRRNLANVVLFQAKLLYPDGTLLVDNGCFAQEFNEMEPLESLQYLSERGLLIGSACSKVVDRKYVLEHGLFFKVGIKNEDIEWVLRLANCLPKYLYSDQYFYVYRKGRSGSITNCINYDYLMSFAEMLYEFQYFTYSNEQVKNCLLGYIAYEYSILMAQSVFIKDKYENRALCNKLKSFSYVLNYDIHPKVKLVNKFVKLFGFRSTKVVLGKYLKYRKR